MFTRTTIIIIAMLALFAGMAQAEIRGVVADAETGEPIAGATVKVKGENIGDVIVFLEWHLLFLLLILP